MNDFSLFQQYLRDKVKKDSLVITDEQEFLEMAEVLFSDYRESLIAGEVVDIGDYLSNLFFIQEEEEIPQRVSDF